MTHFYLVRHAHANWKPDENRPLSKQGLLDAERIAEVLQLFPISAIYASPFRRAYQTVEPFASEQNIPITTLHNLRERQLSGTHAIDFDEAVEAVWRDPFFAHPGGESNVEAQQRGVTVINRLHQHQATDHVVLATHGNLMALILQHFDPSLGYEFWKSLQMPDVYRLNLTAPDEPMITGLWGNP